MRRLREFIARCRSLFARHAADRVLATEIASHLAFLEAKYRAQGLSTEEASFAARREFGNIEWVKEEHRNRRSFLWIEMWAATCITPPGYCEGARYLRLLQ